MQRELAKRMDHGIVVRLLWDSIHNRVLVNYRDKRSGDEFVVEVPRANAMNAFDHPNAYRPELVGVAA
jgi:hypothetical protein